MDSRQHWERVYATRSTTELSWYQREARVSLELIGRAVPGVDASIIDVGGGASTLVDGLLERGHQRVAVLDIAASALDAARDRLGTRAATVSWIVGDVRTYPFAPQSVDIWHDRAVFHFLTTAIERQAYRAQVARAVRPGGHVIVATFASDGPMRCSGLDVRRYSPEELHAEFGRSFDLIASLLETHLTPGGQQQHFQYCLCAFRPAVVVAA